MFGKKGIADSTAQCSQMCVALLVPDCACLDPGRGLVLQNTNNNTPVGCLPLLRILVANLVAFSHRTGRQHPSKRNVTLLDQNITDPVGAIFT
jgi:hypothetical protein